MNTVINSSECQPVKKKSLEEDELEYLNQAVSLSVTYPVWNISRLIKYVFCLLGNSALSLYAQNKFVIVYWVTLEISAKFKIIKTVISKSK